MFIMYVDESGDSGIINGSSPHFILSGLIIDGNNWLKYLDELKKYRKELRKTYGLSHTTEIHANELLRVGKIKEYSKIHKNNRIKILSDCCIKFTSIFSDAKIINICLDKKEFKENHDLQTIAWERLMTRYNRYLNVTQKSKGIIVSDDTENAKIKSILRKLRRYNSVKDNFGKGYYNAATTNIIEDIIPRDSKDSYFIQVADVIAHTLYRREYPKGSLKKYNVDKFFNNFKPILLLEASSKDNEGIVR